MIPPLETTHGHGNQDLEFLSQNIKRFVKVLEDNPTLDGHLLENISLTAGDNTINHRLGRPLRGWYLTRFWDPTNPTYPAGAYPAGADVEYVPFLYDKQDTNGSTDKTLILHAAEACNVSLWVF